jgi:hypothetical protein
MRGRRSGRRWDGRTLRETFRDQTDELLRVLEEMRVAEWRRNHQKSRSPSGARAMDDERGIGTPGG